MSENSQDQKALHARKDTIMEHTPISIPGLQFIQNVVSQEEHDRLVAVIDQQPWLLDLQRRVQHYGYRYDYKSRSVDDSQFLGPLPEWGQFLLAQFRERDLINQ